MQSTILTLWLWSSLTFARNYLFTKILMPKINFRQFSACWSLHTGCTQFANSLNTVCTLFVHWLQFQSHLLIILILFICQRTTGIREQIFAIPLADYCSWRQPAPGTGEQPARRRRLSGGEARWIELPGTWGPTIIFLKVSSQIIQFNNISTFSGLDPVTESLRCSSRIFVVLITLSTPHPLTIIRGKRRTM